MAAGPIVKPLDILKERSANVLPSWVLLIGVYEQLRFQCGKEALDDRIVPTMARAARGALDAAGRQPLLIRHRPILTARFE